MYVSRWILVVMITALAVGMLLWARGPDHQRGDDVGARDQVSSVTSVSRT